MLLKRLPNQSPALHTGSRACMGCIIVVCTVSTSAAICCTRLFLDICAHTTAAVTAAAQYTLPLSAHPFNKQPPVRCSTHPVCCLFVSRIIPCACFHPACSFDWAGVQLCGVLQHLLLVTQWLCHMIIEALASAASLFSPTGQPYARALSTQHAFRICAGHLVYHSNMHAARVLHSAAARSRKPALRNGSGPTPGQSCCEQPQKRAGATGNHRMEPGVLSTRKAQRSADSMRAERLQQRAQAGLDCQKVHCIEKGCAKKQDVALAGLSCRTQNLPNIMPTESTCRF